MSQMYPTNNTMPNNAQDIPIWVDLLFMAVVLLVAVIFAVNYLNLQRQITNLDNAITTVNKEINSLMKTTRNKAMTLWDVQTDSFKLYVESTGMIIPNQTCIVQMSRENLKGHMIAGEVPQRNTPPKSIATIQQPPLRQWQNTSATNK